MRWEQRSACKPWRSIGCYTRKPQGSVFLFSPSPYCLTPEELVQGRHKGVQRHKGVGVNISPHGAGLFYLLRPLFLVILLAPTLFFLLLRPLFSAVLF